MIRSFLGGSDEIRDGEERENQSLDDADDHVESKDSERKNLRNGREKTQMCEDHCGSDHQQHLARKNISEQPHRKRHRASEFVDDVDGEHRDAEIPRFYEQMLVIPESVTANPDKLDQEDRCDGERSSRIEVGGRRLADKGEQPDLVQEQNEDEDRDDVGYKWSAVFAQNAGCQFAQGA